MKKIINGKMYNTETAKYCGGYEFSNCGDFNYVCEELYQKKTGELYLYPLLLFLREDGIWQFIIAVSKVLHVRTEEARLRLQHIEVEKS